MRLFYRKLPRAIHSPWQQQAPCRFLCARKACAHKLVPTPFPYHPSRGRVSPLLLGEQLPHVDVAQVDPDRTVHQPAGHRVGLHAAAEAAVSVGRRVLRAEDGGAIRVAPLHELGQEPYGHVFDVLGKPLVDDWQLVARASSGSWRRSARSPLARRAPSAGRAALCSARSRASCMPAWPCSTCVLSTPSLITTLSNSWALSAAARVLPASSCHMESSEQSEWTSASTFVGLTTRFTRFPRNRGASCAQRLGSWHLSRAESVGRRP